MFHTVAYTRRLGEAENHSTCRRDLMTGLLPFAAVHFAHGISLRSPYTQASCTCLLIPAAWTHVGVISAR
jgi:hypothetical protein